MSKYDNFEFGSNIFNKASTGPEGLVVERALGKRKVVGSVLSHDLQKVVK